MNQAWFWQLGLAFMFVPSLINLMVRIYRDCRGRERLSWREWAVMCAVITPLYPLYVITDSINTAVRTLQGTVNNWKLIHTNELQLMVILGEWEFCTKIIVILSDMFSYQ